MWPEGGPTSIATTQLHADLLKKWDALTADEIATPTEVFLAVADAEDPDAL